MEMIEKRIAALEQENRETRQTVRRYRALLALFAVGLAGMALLGASQENRPYKLIKALEYQVVDESGKMLVRLSGDSNGHGKVWVLDASGKGSETNAVRSGDLTGAWTGTSTGGNGSTSASVVIVQKDETIEITLRSVTYTGKLTNGIISASYYNVGISAMIKLTGALSSDGETITLLDGGDTYTLKRQ